MIGPGLASAAWVITLAAAFASPPQEPSSCRTCHEKERTAEAGGTHARAAPRCTECHGGDPQAPEKERAHGKDFSGKISRSAIPSLCARCHSDPRKMNPFGLPTDQHAQFLTSQHGESLARGGTAAAVCTDCHGTHGILKGRDPASPIAPSNVPATCGRCHSDRATMEPLSHPWTAGDSYRRGVHGKLLFEAHDTAAPTCATCHGNHGAAPPGASEAGNVCGKCHSRQREHFESSPHAFYARDGSFKGCVACHGNHEILTDGAAVARRCAPCHEPQDKEMKKFADLGAALASARAAVGATEGRIARLARSGFPTDEEQVLLQTARTAVLELAPLQHTLDAARIDAGARTAAAVLGEIEGRLDRKERQELLKRAALVPLWAFLAFMAWVFQAKAREIERRNDGNV